MDRRSGQNAEQRGRPVTTLEAAKANDCFDQFLYASTLKTILGTYRNICDLLHLKPNVVPLFYPKLKANLTTWKAKALWKKFDLRANNKIYGKGKLCPHTRVLIIGAGPCGLRSAIEAQLLGAKVVVVEKRDRISRNNVLHLWPFVIDDLRSLGAKKFFGKFCAGSIDHISIRQLQCILLKVALLLGVEIHTEVSFEGLIEPNLDDKTGWRADFKPAEHPVSQFEFDVIIGADGKRNTLQGFKRKEFRGKLAIAITANFINKRSEAEARVEEISGVAFIFNQKFFKDLYAKTGIDLENIVYYKDDTHYFVMTAKKQSLIEKGVIKRDLADTAKLLSHDNVDRDALHNYAREAAEFSTNYNMLDLEFAVNHYGQPDVAMFDFTSMYAAENASRIIERHGYKLFTILVGDSLLEPFWPTGSGCARGFLSSMDAGWSIRGYGSGLLTPLEVIAERESIYRLLAQTTPENLNKDYKSYTLDPSTRYPNLNKNLLLPQQALALYDTDDPNSILHSRTPMTTTVVDMPKKRRRRDTHVDPDTLLSWVKEQVREHKELYVQDVTKSFKDGRILCAIISHYRPDLLDYSAINSEDSAKTNQMVFDLLEKEIGIPPVMTGAEMANSDDPDYLTMVSYLTQIYDAFRCEIPHIKHPKLDFTETKRHESAFTKNHPALLKKHVNASQSPMMVAVQGVRSNIRHKKRKTNEKINHCHVEERAKRIEEIVQNRTDRQNKRRQQRKMQTDQFLKSMIMLQGNCKPDHSEPFEDYSIFVYRQTAPNFEDRVKDLEKKFTYIPDRENRVRAQIKGETDEDFKARIKGMEDKCYEMVQTDKKPKDLMRAIGKIDNTDWNIKEIEKKIIENKLGKNVNKDKEKVPKWSREQFLARQTKMEKQHLERQDSTGGKFAEIDKNIRQLDQKLKEGTIREIKQQKVAKITEKLLPKGETEAKPAQKNVQNTKNVVISTQGNSKICHFCLKCVYLVERLSAEGKFFHRGCFRCQYCHTSLRLGSYLFDREGKYGFRFYCSQHFGMPGELKISKVTKKTSDDSDKRLLSGVAGVDLLDRVQTPERIEFSNLSTGNASSDHEESLSQMDEDEWTDRNFGASAAELGSTDDESSSLSGNDSDNEEAYEDALEEPPTKEGTLKLVEKLNKKYSSTLNYSSDEDYGSSDDNYYSSSGEDETDTATEGEEEIQARELRKQEVRVEPPVVHTDTGTDTEVKAPSNLDKSNNSTLYSDPIPLLNPDPTPLLNPDLNPPSNPDSNPPSNPDSNSPSNPDSNPPSNPLKENGKCFGKVFVPKFNLPSQEPILIIKPTPKKLNPPKEVGKPKVAVKNVAHAKKFFGEIKTKKLPSNKIITRRNSDLGNEQKQPVPKEKEQSKDSEVSNAFNFEPLDDDIDDYIENLIQNEEELLKPIDPNKFKTETPPPEINEDDEEVSSSIEDLLKALESETKTEDVELLQNDQIEDLLTWMDDLDYQTTPKVYRSFSDAKYKHLEKTLKNPEKTVEVVSRLPKDNIKYFEMHLAGKKIPDTFGLARSKTDINCNQVSRKSVDLEALGKVDIKKVLKKFESFDEDYSKVGLTPQRKFGKRNSMSSFSFKNNDDNSSNFYESKCTVKSMINPCFYQMNIENNNNIDDKVYNIKSGTDMEENTFSSPCNNVECNNKTQFVQDILNDIVCNVVKGNEKNIEDSSQFSKNALSEVTLQNSFKDTNKMNDIKEENKSLSLQIDNKTIDTSLLNWENSVKHEEIFPKVKSKSIIESFQKNVSENFVEKEIDDMLEGFTILTEGIENEIKAAENNKKKFDDIFQKISELQSKVTAKAVSPEEGHKEQQLLFTESKEECKDQNSVSKNDKTPDKSNELDCLNMHNNDNHDIRSEHSNKKEESNVVNSFDENSVPLKSVEDLYAKVNKKPKEENHDVINYSPPVPQRHRKITPPHRPVRQKSVEQHSDLSVTQNTPMIKSAGNSPLCLRKSDEVPTIPLRKKCASPGVTRKDISQPVLPPRSKNKIVDVKKINEGEKSVEKKEQKRAKSKEKECSIQLTQPIADIASDDDTSSESSSEVQNSATEISTDSEFAQDDPTPTRETPLICFNDRFVAKYRGQYMSAKKVQVKSTEIQKSINPKSQDKVVPLKITTPVVQTVRKIPPPLKLNLTEGYALNRTQSTGGIASKVSLELKKKYLLGETNNANSIQKSGSASTLDSKFKSFHSTISDCQKLLKPAAEVSPGMQTFCNKLNERASPLSPLLISTTLQNKEFPKVDLQEKTTKIEDTPEPFQNETEGRPRSPVHETSIIVPQIDWSQKKQINNSTNSSESSSSSSSSDSDVNLPKSPSIKAFQHTPPKVEIQENLPPDSLNYNKKDIEDSTKSISNEKKTLNQPKPLPTFGNDSLLNQVHSVLHSKINKPEDNDKNSGRSTPSNNSSHDQITNALTETELSDWARDGIVSDDYEDEDFDLNSEKEVDKMNESSLARKLKDSKKTVPIDVKNMHHVCSKTEENDRSTEYVSNILNPNLDNIEFMDTGSEASDDDVVEVKNNGYVQFHDEDDILDEDSLSPVINVYEAKNPKIKATFDEDPDDLSTVTRNTGYCVFEPSQNGKDSFGGEVIDLKPADLEKLKEKRNLYENEEDSLLIIEAGTTTEENTCSDSTVKNITQVIPSKEKETKIDFQENNNMLDKKRLEDKLAQVKKDMKKLSEQRKAEHLEEQNLRNNIEFDQHCQRLQSKVDFNNAKDSIDIRKSRKQSKTESPPKPDLIQEEKEISPIRSRKEQLEIERDFNQKVIQEMVMNKMKAQNKSLERKKRNRNPFSPSISPSRPYEINRSQTTQLNSPTPDVILTTMPLQKSQTGIDLHNTNEPKPMPRTKYNSGDKFSARPLSVHSSFLRNSSDKNKSPIYKLTTIDAFSLPDINKVTLNDDFKTPKAPPRTRNEETMRTVEKLKEDARARARLLSDEDLGLSPEDKLARLRQRVNQRGKENHSDMSSFVLHAEKQNPLIYANDTLSKKRNNAVRRSKSGEDYIHLTRVERTKSIPEIQNLQRNIQAEKKVEKQKFFKSDPNLLLDAEGKKEKKKTKDRERRKSITKLITDLFTKKKDSNQVINLGNKSFLSRISPRGKDKSKELIKEEPVRRMSLSENRKPIPGNVSPPPIPPLPVNYTGTNSIEYNSDHEFDWKQTDRSSCDTLDQSGLQDGSHCSRRSNRSARKMARQSQLKRHRTAQEIQRKLEEVEVKTRELEQRGVHLEKAVRGEITGRVPDEPELLREWFDLMKEMNELRRFETELTIRAKELELEDRHSRLQQELKERLDNDGKKTQEDFETEGSIINEMMEIVAKRDSLSKKLKDLLRYSQDDKEFEEQMLAKGIGSEI